MGPSEYEHTIRFIRTGGRIDVSEPMPTRSLACSWPSCVFVLYCKTPKVRDKRDEVPSPPSRFPMLQDEIFEAWLMGAEWSQRKDHDPTSRLHSFMFSAVHPSVSHTGNDLTTKRQLLDVIPFSATCQKRMKSMVATHLLASNEGKTSASSE